jgi:hypothetical protein
MDRMKHARLALLLTLTFLVALAACAVNADAEDERFGEYEVKAAFIYNIAKFVEWPEKALSESKSVFNLCIIGADPFGRSVQQIEGKIVKGRRLEVTRVASVREVKGCNALFISRSEKERLAGITEAAGSLSVLTIGDTEGYAPGGVMVNFRLEQRKVRFDIDLEKTKRSRLLISAQLLKLARTVYGRQ